MPWSMAMPDLPTVAEQGVAGLRASSWQGFFVPATTPPGIVAKIYPGTKNALAAPDVQERQGGLGKVCAGSEGSQNTAAGIGPLSQMIMDTASSVRHIGASWC